MTNPQLITTPFAENGTKNIIPEGGAAEPQLATMGGGFPEITQRPINEGGIPPERADFNGILNLYGQHLVHLNKGLPYEFDQDFANSIGGYPLNARIMLDNGDIVKSTVAGNTVNPNVDMTGWVKANSAGQIFDSKGNSQEAVNNSFEFKKSSLEDKSISQMLVFNKIDFDVDETITAQASIENDSKSIKSNKHVLSQTTPQVGSLWGGIDKNNISISGLSFSQDKSIPPSGGTGNNHQMVKFQGGKYNKVVGCEFNGQFAISMSYGAADAGNPLKDRSGKFGLVLLNECTDAQGMFIETIGSQYGRIIGNIVDSQTTSRQHGIRLSGYNKINNPSELSHAPNIAQVGSSNIFVNMADGISAQNSSKYSNLSAFHVSDSDTCIHATLGTVPENDPTMHRFDFTGYKVKKLANLQYLNHTKMGFAVDGSAFTSTGIDELSGRVGTGFNHYEGIVLNAATRVLTGRYSHNLYNLQIDGSSAEGAVLNGSYGGGTIISNGCTTGVSVGGSFNNLTIVSTNNINNGLSMGGSGNTINIQTDGNVSVGGNDNIITGRIGGNLVVTGTGNKFIGEVVGTVTRTGTTDNNFTGLKGWSGVVVLPEQTTDGAGRVTVAVPKHTNAQIRTIYATIPLNTSEWSLKVISISGGNVVFELQDNAGNGVSSTTVTFNYEYSCS